MGIAEINTTQLAITSHIILYGNAADENLAEQVRDEIESMWNEPDAVIPINDQEFRIRFVITAEYNPQLTPDEIIMNVDPRNNYFRVEEFAHGNISFVDGLGCNSGYFKKENLYEGSTTAAHEYGHTLGLRHPTDMDYRGKGVPGIMYPRGTLVDPPYQYNPNANAGDSNNGGTMHPRYRKVRWEDIRDLGLHKLLKRYSPVIIGEFSNIWHPDHSMIAPDDVLPPGIRG